MLIKRAYKTELDPTPRAIKLHRLLHQLKQTDVPLMDDVSTCAPQEALRNLDTALKPGCGTNPTILRPAASRNRPVERYTACKTWRRSRRVDAVTRSPSWT
jgi:hypothetical protein